MDKAARKSQPTLKLVCGTRCPKMIGMKKPPMAARVSMRPVAVPMYSCLIRLTLGGTDNQAAKPKMRKKPIPMPSGQRA